MNKNVYKINLRDFEFLLWEQFDIENNILKLNSYKQYSKSYLQKEMIEAVKFSQEKLGKYYQESDRHPCERIDEEHIKILDIFYPLWDEFKSRWQSILVNASIPSIITRMVAEMFMGANPSFMTYSGFAAIAAKLIKKFGTEQQKHLFVDKLKEAQWSSCFCVTEEQAGSDISAIETHATRLTDDKYLIHGEKIFISGGMHDMTENIIYIVVAKTKKTESNYGLSCFIVPRFIAKSNGTFESNGVTCKKLVNKMGFKGCVNVSLKFGEKKPCYGHLLGGKENIALSQIIVMMHDARLSTGLFAVGMASSAYLNSLEYAKKRIQGRKYTESFDHNSQRIPIIHHFDVQKMLMEMKSKVEGSRALIAHLTFYESYVEHYKKISGHEARNIRSYYESLINLLNPIVKAYLSDEAWRVCELAIQVFGGNGYTSDFPVEQYARDVKILSIWEGTNYIQSQALLREKLGFGNAIILVNRYLNEVNKIFERIRGADELEPEIIAVQNSFETLKKTLKILNNWTKGENLIDQSAYSKDFLKIMAECTIALLLLEAAAVSIRALKNPSIFIDQAFYKGKIATAKFYIWNVLPNVLVTSSIIEASKTKFGNVVVFDSDLNGINSDYLPKVPRNN